MIIGMGSDICNISRIEKSLQRFGERFEKRCFTENEIKRANARPLLRAGTFAKRFAAKEAFSKAIGTGMRHGVAWRDIEVANAPSGKPSLKLNNAAAAILQKLTPAGFKTNVMLSMTDDYPYAMAFVIIEALPDTVDK